MTNKESFSNFKLIFKICDKKLLRSVTSITKYANYYKARHKFFMQFNFFYKKKFDFNFRNYKKNPGSYRKGEK